MIEHRHFKADGKTPLNARMPYFHDVVRSFSPVEIDLVLRRSGYGMSSRMNIFRQLLKIQKEKQVTVQREGEYPWRGATIVHMIAGSGLVNPCHVNLNDDQTHTVTTNFEHVTCIECRVGWLTYERDSYKESFEASRRECESRDHKIVRQKKQIEHDALTIRALKSDKRKTSRTVNQLQETAAAEVAKNLDLMAENRRLKKLLEDARPAQSPIASIMDFYFGPPRQHNTPDEIRKDAQY